MVRLQRHLLCLTNKLILMHAVQDILLLVTEDGSIDVSGYFYIPGIQFAPLSSAAHLGEYPTASSHTSLARDLSQVSGAIPA